MQHQPSGYLARPAPSSLADVVETVLDKGLTLDVYARVSLLGIELITIDARVVLASIDTYLRFAEATNRLDLDDKGGESPVDLLIEGTGNVIESAASHVVEDKIEGVLESADDVVDKVVDSAHEVADSVEEVAGKAAAQVERVLPGHHG